MKKERKTRSDKFIARRKDKDLRKVYVKAYGVDGEKLEKSKYDKLRKRFYKVRIRTFCKECIKFPECQGKNWGGCEFREILLEIVNK
jgi:hypothetical protein